MTYARIVKTAAGQMYDRGVARTSTEDVLAGAVISNSQLYHYFANKDALVRAVIKYQTRQVLAGQEPYLSHVESFETLVVWRDQFVRDQSGRRCPLGSLASELAHIDEPARRLLADGYAQWAAAIERGLRVMRERGDLRPEADPAGLALATLAALQGGLQLSRTVQDPDPLKAGLDLAIGYIQHFAA